MKIAIVTVTLLLTTGCSIFQFPHTHEELKSTSKFTHTICSERKPMELYKALVKQSAICHMDIKSENYVERKYAYYVNRYYALKGKEAIPHSIALWTKGGGGLSPSVLSLVEINETKECSSSVDFYFSNGFWEGALTDYKAWINGDDGVCELM